MGTRRINGSPANDRSAGLFYDELDTGRDAIRLTEKGRQYLYELARRPGGIERRPMIRQRGRGRS